MPYRTYFVFLLSRKERRMASLPNKLNLNEKATHGWRGKNSKRRLVRLLRFFRRRWPLPPLRHRRRCRYRCRSHTSSWSRQRWPRRGRGRRRAPRPPKPIAESTAAPAAVGPAPAPGHRVRWLARVRKACWFRVQTVNFRAGRGKGVRENKRAEHRVPHP